MFRINRRRTVVFNEIQLKKKEREVLTEMYQKKKKNFNDLITILNCTQEANLTLTSKKVDFIKTLI